MAMRKRATKALDSHTTTVLKHLQADKDEMLRGMHCSRFRRSLPSKHTTHMYMQRRLSVCHGVSAVPWSDPRCVGNVLSIMNRVDSFA